MGVSPLLKVICALLQIEYHIPADLADDLFEVSEKTVADCLAHFCSAVCACFASHYLREPTVEDVTRIEKQFPRLGVPGCIGCLDCAGWEWKNFFKELQGVMRGKEGRSVLSMKVVADLYLWIWSFHFGLPGGFNDLNVLEVSNHLEKLLAGDYNFPPLNRPILLTGSVSHGITISQMGSTRNGRYLFSQLLSLYQTRKGSSVEDKKLCESVLRASSEFSIVDIKFCL